MIVQDRRAISFRARTTRLALAGAACLAVLMLASCGIKGPLKPAPAKNAPAAPPPPVPIPELPPSSGPATVLP